MSSSGENDDERSRAAAAPRVELRLASAPGFDAFDLWRSSLEQLFETTLVGDRTAEFRGGVTGFHLGDALTFNSTSVAQRLERTRSRVRRSSIDHIMLQLQTSGRLTGDYEGQSVVLRPGDISFVDFGRATHSVDTDFSRITLIIPRGQLPRTLQERDLHGVVLDRNQPATRLLAQYVRALFQSAGQLSQPEAAASIEAALILTESALGDRGRLSLNQQNAAGRTLRQLAVAYIEPRLAQPDLAPNPIAAALGISRSTLYGLFTADDGVMNYISLRRLDLSFDAIVRGRPDITIGQIAFAHGFSSEAHFSRAFRRRFGITASEARRLAASAVTREGRRGGDGSAEEVMAEWVRMLGRGKTTGA